MLMYGYEFILFIYRLCSTRLGAPRSYFYLFLTPKIAQSCLDQVKLRVEFTLLTRTVKDPLMFIVICALTVEDGPCFREDKMAR